MRIQMSKPRVYARHHLLAFIDYRKSYLAIPGMRGAIKVTDDTGKTIHLDPKTQELFEEVEGEQ